MNRMKRLTGRKILLATVALCAFGIAKAQNAQAAKDTLTLTLDKALTIALDENPTMKVAAEEIALKKVGCLKQASLVRWTIRLKRLK